MRFCLSVLSILSILLVLVFSMPVSADTFLIAIEEIQNGENVPRPMAGQEGIMAVLFDCDHVVFDMPFNTEKECWDCVDFSWLVSMAVSSGARFMAALRIYSEIDPPPDHRTKRKKPASISSLTQYSFWDAESNSLLSKGELSMNNHGREQDIDYNDLLYKIGETLAGEILQVWDKHTAGDG